MTVRAFLTRTGARAAAPLALGVGLAVASLSGSPAAIAQVGQQVPGVGPGEARPNYSSAAAINSDGLVVGAATSEDGPETRHPVMWRPTSMGDYKIVDLGTMGGYDRGDASSVNDRGQIVGSFGDLDDGVAFVRDPDTGQMTDLGTLGGGGAIATDINEKGQVVGWSTTESGARRPFLWHPKTGVMDDLGTLRSRTLSMAVAINDKGTVLGMAWTPRAHGTAWHAWLWHPGADRLLRLERHGLAAGTRPEDLNEKGQVVGCTYDDDSPSTAVLWRPKVESTLRIPSLGGDACAWGVNEDSVVTGWSTNDNGQTRSVIWRPGRSKMASLGIQHKPSSGQDVSDSGLVVGSFGTGTSSHAFLWRPKNGHVIDLGLLFGETTPLSS
jgi:probable HAF family extracellular repeat protein